MRRVATCIAVVGLGLVAACGGSDSGTAAPASSAGSSPAGAASTGASTTGAKCSATVTVANLAVTNAAALVLGVQKGLFKEQGLEVTLKDTAAASTQPAVVSGEAQFAFTNVPSALAGASNGLPVKVVAPAAAYPDPGQPSSLVVMAKPGAGITKPADLAGKKVAVDTLFQLPHISMIQALQASKVDPSSFKVSEVPYPAMLEAVERGQVDAGNFTEPFLTQAVAKGYVPVLPDNVGSRSGDVQALWVTSAAYAKSKPDVVGCFQRAVTASNEYATAHPDETRAVLPTYTKVPEPLARTIVMPNYKVTLDKGPFERYAKIMKDNNVIKKDVDIPALIGS